MPKRPAEKGREIDATSAAERRERRQTRERAENWDRQCEASGVDELRAATDRLTDEVLSHARGLRASQNPGFALQKEEQLVEAIQQLRVARENLIRKTGLDQLDPAELRRRSRLAEDTVGEAMADLDELQRAGEPHPAIDQVRAAERRIAAATNDGVLIKLALRAAGGK